MNDKKVLSEYVCNIIRENLVKRCPFLHFEGFQINDFFGKQKVKAVFDVEIFINTFNKVLLLQNAAFILT